MRRHRCRPRHKRGGHKDRRDGAVAPMLCHAAELAPGERGPEERGHSKRSDDVPNVSISVIRHAQCVRTYPKVNRRAWRRSGPLTNTSAQISTKLVGRITPQLKLRTSSIKALANGERNPQIVRLLQRTLGRCHEMRDANSIA